MLSRLVSRANARRALKVTVAIVCVYFAAALALTYWPSKPAFDTSVGSAQAPTLPDSGIPVSIPARDGTALFAQQYGESDDSVVIWIHGITSESGDHAAGARAFHDETGAVVITPDLRGHAKSGGRAYDVDYIGQYEDDLEDMVRWASARFDAPRIIIAGHSMGGGVVSRYALKDDAPAPDAYLLLAPSFGEAPTQRNDDDGGPDLSQWVHFNTPRLFGLLMFNIAGITALDDLPILIFNEPTGISQYSYRATMSGQPIRPLTADIALQRIQAPLLVVVGADDDVFVADAYPDFVSTHSAGETVILPGLDHNEVVDDPAAIAVMVEWYRRLPAR